MDYFTRVDLSKLYPKFRDQIIQLQLNCLALGSEYYGTSGLRDFNEQAELYALGRTKRNVDWQQKPPMGGIVTNAKPGQSLHNYGIACDFALDKDTVRAGLQPDWEPHAYLVLGEESQKVHLVEWGGSWSNFKDYPHVQVNIGALGLTLKDLQTAYAHGSHDGVFKLLDAHWK